MANRQFHIKGLGVFAVVFFLSFHSAPAWMRGYAPDDELVQRSDSIVIGHIDGSFQAVKFRPAEPNGFQYLEYRTTLIISEVIRGNAKVGKTPLILHYGIKPVILKENPSFQERLNPVAADQNTDPIAPVGIMDICDWDHSLSDNIRKDHLFFLRVATHAGPGPGGEDADAPGIKDPQDVQSLDRKPYYLAIVSGNIDALTPFTAGTSYQAEQARTAQDRMIVMKIAQIPDPSARCDQLLPLYVKGAPYTDASHLAFDQIIACGSLGAAKLIPLFKNPPDANFELGTILSGWWKTNYKESVPLIIDWLTKEDQRWSTLTKADQIFASREGPGGGPPYHDPRSVSFRNMYAAIVVLDDFHARESKALIQRIRNRWQRAAPFLSNNDFLKTCDDALTDLK